MWPLVLLVLQSPGATPSASAPRPPNIIHIVADDVGYDDVSCYGARDIATPNIDRLAAEGLRFTSFYAPSATCTPTRAALMTGCYAQRVGLPNVLFPDSTIGLAESETTIAELLAARGYATALVGKWHLGHLPPFLPTAHGFQSFFGIPYPNDHVPERLTSKEPRRSRGFPPMPLYSDTQIVEQPAQLATLPERLVERAVRFVEEHREQPFYLQLSNIETHTPWLVAQRFQNRSAAGVWGDAVQCLDWAVGELTQAIERLELAEHTLIVVSSDNGPLVHRYPELEGIYGHAATVNLEREHVLREGKYQARYEGGSRVPCIARWRGRIPAGGVSDAIVAGFDWYTTFAALAGAAAPQDRIVDGRDLAPLLSGQPEAAAPRETFWHYEGYNLVALRHERWKLVFPRDGANSPELYDLSVDLRESRDLAKERPEIVERLVQLAEAARADLGDASTQREGANRRPPGRAP